MVQSGNRQTDFERNYRWQQALIHNIEDIITEKKIARHLLTVREAGEVEDMTQATDMVVTVEAKTIAVRLRRPGCRYRDFTIRARVPSGYKTELDKLREGFADWYLYAWMGQGRIANYIFVDMDKVRANGLLEVERRLIRNVDGTHFVSIGIDELQKHDCIASMNLSGRGEN